MRNRVGLANIEIFQLLPFTINKTIISLSRVKKKSLTLYLRSLVSFSFYVLLERLPRVSQNMWRSSQSYSIRWKSVSFLKSAVRSTGDSSVMNRGHPYWRMTGLRPSKQLSSLCINTDGKIPYNLRPLSPILIEIYWMWQWSLRTSLGQSHWTS